MFYFESDRTEIKSWIKDSEEKVHIALEKKLDFTDIFDEIQRKNRDYITNQLVQLNAEFQAQLSLLKREIIQQVRAEFQAEIDNLKSELADSKKTDPSTLRKEITQQVRAEFQAEIDNLKSKFANSKKPDYSTLRKEITQQVRAEFQAEIDNLKSELADVKKTDSSTLRKEIIQQVRAEFQAEIDNLKSKFADLKKSVPQPTKIETSPEEIFYLKPCDEVLISDNRENISAQISKALNVDDIKKFLAENKTETSRKFQKLINSHVNSVKSFVENLKLNSLDDEELSETVTSKYFKLFQAIIFDNLIVAVKRGLNTSKFYGEFLTKLNDYLERCGIYTVNAKSDVKATDEDYKNMSPQPIKTSDKTQAGIIREIERLPYRINYIDEFGEEKFLQYNGIMNIFKAV